MTDRQELPTEALVADYVRSAMRVDPPHDLADAVMRAVSAVPQQPRTFLGSFAPLAPAFGVAAVIATLFAIGVFVLAPRNVGPAPDPAPVSPSPSLTSEAARILAAEGDVIRIPALDGQGTFGTITIERGAEKAGYDGFVPIAFDDVFFVELYVTYQPTRATDEQFGEWEFAFAVDADGDGFDADDVLQRGVGFSGGEEMPGYESGPQPMLEGRRFGMEPLEGWLVMELPAAAARWDVHLVYGHGEYTEGVQDMEPDASALLRRAGDPVGVTEFDPDAFPVPSGSPPPQPSLYALPSPVPSPLPTFEPVADEEADALFVETQQCTNEQAGVVVTFPASWHTNEAHEDWVACTFFDPEPIDVELALSGFGPPPKAVVMDRPEWYGGIEEANYERLPIGDRATWRISFSPDQMSTGINYLIPRTEDPYGPFVHLLTLADDGQAVAERMLVRFELID